MLLATDRLSKQYDRTLALDHVSLQVRQGEVYGLIGPNGAGKTTLLRLLALADEPTTGKIFLAGQPLRYSDPKPHLKRRLGFLPDNYPLYDDLTVEGYLDYMARLYSLRNPVRSQRLQTVMTQVQLEDKRHSLIKTLSRGMRQRLSLAQAILHQPDLLLMDEPVSGLDPLARSQFRRIVKQLQAEGMTIIIQVWEPPDHWVSLIHQQAGVRSIEVRPSNTLRVEFVGNPTARAKLLQALVNNGLKIINFHQEQENLESIFLTLGSQNTA
ncbi:MAG: ABC transporter ATP-binding protein [Synechococcales bacterium]|nr:ABC transporter ATP-binding protein [Synechococcales bacterium]